MHCLRLKACALLCLALSCGVAVAQQPFQITWAGERLSVRASNAPLVDVVAEVSRLTGIEVTGGDKLVGNVSVELSALPVAVALAELLSHVNYLVQERRGPEGRPVLSVTVYSMAGARDASSGSAPPIPIMSATLLELVAQEAALVEEEKQEERDDDPDSFDDDVREAKEEAAQLLGEGAFGPDAAVSSLARHAANLDNEEIRLEALRALSTRPMEDTLEVLIALLSDDSPDVRGAAVEILGRARDAASLAAMSKLVMKAENRNVRIGALRILALRADPSSAALLRTFIATVDLRRDTQLRRVANEILEEYDHRERSQPKGR